MLVDANILLYAVDSTSPFHARAADWMSEQLNGPRRVGFPWQSLVAFLRISTHPRASARPLAPKIAARFVEDWLDSDVAWIPQPGPGHASVLAGLIRTHQLRGNLISDAHLAALAIEHGLTMCSADTDFARFTELAWMNPVRP
ncbi:MAG: TA system VapC family ribonuclease toxin [Geodermatophilaceae bacterium]|jgi:toxin-antitoxin system PIN domain toxin